MPGMTLVLETTPDCKVTPRVLLAIEEAAVPVELVVRDEGHFVDAHGIPGPCLVEGDFRLFEGNAIMRYVGRSHPAAGLLPKDPRDLAQMDRWIDFSILRIGMSVAGGQMDAAMRYLGVLDRVVAGDVWLCKTFSLADCSFATLAMLAAQLPIARVPNVGAYLERLRARPAWSRVMARLQSAAAGEARSWT
jgi:glutathione S-transferase